MMWSFFFLFVYVVYTFFPASMVSNSSFYLDGCHSPLSNPEMCTYTVFGKHQWYPKEVVHGMEPRAMVPQRGGLYLAVCDSR